MDAASERRCPLWKCGTSHSVCFRRIAFFTLDLPMPFEFEPSESIKFGLRRMATEVLNEAIAQLRDDSLKRDEKIHRTRRHGKQLRSLLRLAGAGLESKFKPQDQWLRDTSRLISHLRDSKVIYETYRELIGADNSTIEKLPDDDLLRQLNHHRKGNRSSKKTIDQTLDAVRERLEHQQTLVKRWCLQGKGLRILDIGLRTTYQEARDAMKRVTKTREPTAFHEWRKHVKYHFHHCRMMTPIWPAPLALRANELDDLGGWLGKEHDLAVLIEHVQPFKAKFSQAKISEVIELAFSKRTRLQVAALAAGQRLFAEDAPSFTGRHLRYWRLWHKVNSQSP